MWPLSPARECAIVRNFTSRHHHVDGPRHEVTGHQRRDDREHLARRARDAASTRRSVRIERLDLVADPLRLTKYLRASRNPQANFVRIAVSPPSRPPEQRIDA